MKQPYYSINLSIQGPITLISKLEAYQFLVTEGETDTRVLVNHRLFYNTPNKHDQ